MLCEMVDISKKAPLGIIENVLVKMNRFLFLSDFIIIDNTLSETIILGRPLLATIHAETDVFAGKFSLGINEDRISCDAIRKRIFMVNSGLISRPQSPTQSNNQIYYEESGKKGHILDNILEYCNHVHNKNYGWHNHEFKNEERGELGIEEIEYRPPEVQVETLKVKKYSFEDGQTFVYDSKDVYNVLPLGWKNGSKFKE
ncbi:hypothetical protein Tco_0093082 [Tanacetum coccineum]